MAQSLGKCAGFENFSPDITKIRPIGYALGLEQGQTKPQINALLLDIASMGHRPYGWKTGVIFASKQIYGRFPVQLRRRTDQICKSRSPGAGHWRGAVA